MKNEFRYESRGRKKMENRDQGFTHFYCYDDTENGRQNSINHIKLYVDNFLGYETSLEDYTSENNHPCGDDCWVVEFNIPLSEFLSFHGWTPEAESAHELNRKISPKKQRKFKNGID